jgi:transcription termination factor Rho
LIPQYYLERKFPTNYMPIKSKLISSEPISVEDVIGAPQDKKDEVKEIKPSVVNVAVPVSSRMVAPVIKTPVIHTPDSQKPSSFVPGLVTPALQQSPPVYGNNNYSSNGYDRNINTPTKAVSGFLDIMQEGHGFLRPKFLPGEGDIYISQSQIRKFQLREGDEVAGQARMPKENERYLGLLKVEKVNGMPGEDSFKRPHFDDLTPIYPNKQIRFETEKTIISTRIIDIFSPIGFGQRGMIVSPPKAGKTTILKEIAHGISVNHPKAHLMAVLIGERPEEVTDISRSVKGEVIASNFDEAPEEQSKVAEVALDRAKRLVELGRDVIILLDSVTRLARAYNLCVNPSGRTLSGGFDPAALYPAKRFLGAARNCEKGGSLTILGTALIETGSRMDDLIYEEFKGTGNMELHLSRFLQEQRIFPAIDVDKSGTRHEELLIPAEELKKVVTLRHMLSLLGEGQERTATLIDRLSKTKSNKEFIDSLNKG